MAVPNILARTFSEAHAFARNDLGLKHGQYRVVTSAGTIKALWNVDLYLVPGWRRRFDGFTMESAIKWTRMNVIDVEKQRAEALAALPPMIGVAAVPDDTPTPKHHTDLVERVLGGPRDDLQPPGVQLVIPITSDEATAFFETTNGDTMIYEGGPVAPEPEQAEEPAKPEVKRRRRRCKDCGELHFTGDPCAPEAV